MISLESFKGDNPISVQDKTNDGCRYVKIRPNIMGHIYRIPMSYSPLDIIDRLNTKDYDCYITRTAFLGNCLKTLYYINKND